MKMSQRKNQAENKETQASQAGGSGAGPGNISNTKNRGALVPDGSRSSLVSDPRKPMSLERS
jgi:hypothetical protein